MMRIVAIAVLGLMGAFFVFLVGAIVRETWKLVTESRWWEARKERRRRLALLPPVGQRLCGTCKHLTQSRPWAFASEPKEYCRLRPAVLSAVNGKPLEYTWVQICNARRDCALWEANDAQAETE